MDAGLGLRVIEHVLGFAIFHADGVVALDYDGAELLAVVRNAVAEGKIIAAVEQRAEENGDEQGALQIFRKSLRRYIQNRMNQ